MEFMAPMSFGQAQNQIGLGNQFAQQGLAQGAAELEAKALANMFTAQNNPMRLEEQALRNTGMGFENTIQGVKSRSAVDLEEEEKAARRAKLLSAASEDDLKKLQSQAEAEMLNPDPAVQARGQKKLEGSWQELQRRAKAADDLAKAKVIGDGRMAVAGVREGGADRRNDADNAAALQRAQLSAASREKNIAGKANGSLPNAEKAAVSFQMQADNEEDPTERARLAQLAKQYAAYSVALRNATSGSKPDLAAFGIQTNPVVLGIGNTNAPPRTSGAGDPPARSAVINPTGEQSVAERTGRDLQEAEAAYAREKDPKKRAALAPVIGQLREAAATAPKPSAPPKVAAPAQSFADVQKLYPGVPPEKLKEAWKKKFGVDLK